MSHTHSPHFGRSRELTNGDAAGRSIDNPHPSVHTADSALDTALRAVPLPDGLMTRLGLLVFTMPEDAQDQVDWLGC